MSFKILDFEMTFLISLYVVLVQSIIENQAIETVDDNIIVDGIIASEAILDLYDVEMMIATIALYDYQLNYGLICFDDE